MTAINPRLVPRRFRCASIICAWSALISGTIIGTSGVPRFAELLEITGHSALAYASSNALISSFFISTAQKTKSTIEVIFSISFCASITTISFMLSGIGVCIAHLAPTASTYFLPAEREEAAMTLTWNHG